MPKVVYHGTFSESAPHEYGVTFHAGTMNATHDRSYDQIMAGEVSEPAIRQVHSYEISDTAPMSKRIWSDPDIGFTRVENRNEGLDEPVPEVPEHKENRIYPYRNIREDRGSTSYVIPSSFVGNHVKHLGVQFQDLHTESDKDYNNFMGALSVMSGGRYK
jgi:hypothetical protein